MTGRDGAFFGEVIKGQKGVKVDVKEGLLLHISHASLDHNGKGPVSLVIEDNGREFLICTLKDCGHAPLDLNFSSPVVFKTKGSNTPISISGYWEFMADPDMDMMEEFEEEEDEEVAAPPTKNKKSEQVSDDDDEELTPSLLEMLAEEMEEFEEFEEEEEEPEVVPQKKRAAPAAAAQVKRQKGNAPPAAPPAKKGKQAPPPQPKKGKKGGKR